MRFDYPSHWIAEPGEGAVHLHDRPPAVKSCDLEVSIFPLPAEHGRELCLDEMPQEALGTEREAYRQSEIRRVTRGDLEIAGWNSGIPMPSTNAPHASAWHWRAARCSA